ncbi:tellurite resistance TerB family protein [Ewingella americana]|jgi:tellurite resistance protein TerB|uniref:Tellurite resistance TerB n=1 Tax=Ewingella americana TaxID=41202 RepID=A0A502GPQ0_9GAMM|nr:tellurite resistance TerB family protein [Ewingella americana]TPG63240.1 Tellurite resistance TerB [Ewingella americana]
MLDWAKNKFNQGRETLLSEVSRYKGKDFMQGCVAVGTYIAFADGVVSAQEKQKLIKYFEISDTLKVFSTEEVISEFQKLSSKFDFDLDIGRSECLKTLGKLRKKPEEARAAVRLGVMIAKSDASFDEDEKRALLEVCNELGVKPEEFF